jgi:hypothetical protein
LRGGKHPGDIAGCRNSAGYNVIRIDNVLYYGHRLAWFYVKGEWPEFEIDHEDGVPGNDWWDNLRPATHAQNCSNQKFHSNNTSGVKGVNKHPDGKWRAFIGHGSSYLHLGLFDTIEAAAAVRAIAVDELHGKFARGK